MNIITHTNNDQPIAEVVSEEMLISNAEEGLDLLGNLYYQGFDKVVLYEMNIAAAFFDLKNGMAGEILQKFSNYRVRLAIVGDFSAHQGGSIKDFIFESNQLGHINFVATLADAIERLGE